MITRLWTPVYETLYQGEKRGLSHAAKGVFVGLLIEAKKANSHGVVTLPRGETDAAAGVRELIGGTLAEVTAALAGLIEEPDPLVRVEGRPGRLTCRILSWSSRWVLGESPPPSQGQPQDVAVAQNDLRSWRASNGLTQGQLATMLGLSRQSVSDIEAGRRSLRPEELQKLQAYQQRPASPGTAPASPGIVTALTGNLSGTAPASSGITPPLSGICQTHVRHLSGMPESLGGVRGGVSDLHNQERTEEITREDESEKRARERPASPGITPESSGTEPAFAPAQPPASVQQATHHPAHHPAPSSGNATPEEILNWARSAPCLASLVQDAEHASVWAQDVAGAMAMAGARAADVQQAIVDYVAQRGQAARRQRRDELAEDLGRFLKGAKRHGDIARSKAERSHGQPGRPAGDLSDEKREDTDAARRVMPGKTPPPPVWAGR